jgi:hypothetical protein
MKKNTKDVWSCVGCIGLACGAVILVAAIFAAAVRVFRMIAY